MHKKILIVLVLFLSYFVFSQSTNTALSDSYQPPQTVINVTVQLLPGFHADSKNIIYNSGGAFIARSKNYDPDNPDAVITPPPTVYTPASGENYIYTRTYLAPTTMSNNYAPQVQSITYFDGLGRPKQNISIKSTPSGNDLLIPIIYDGFGRPYLDVLPIPLATKNGDIHPNIDQNTGSAFYGGFAYSEKTIENSPLDRVLQQYGPGGDWRSYSKRNIFDYQTNPGNEVLRFVATEAAVNWTDGITHSTLSLATQNYYPSESLYQNMVTDEDGNVSYEFKNGQGHTIMVRKDLGSSDFVDTYYVYNEYDQLAFVISPKAAEMVKSNPVAADLSESGEILKELSYQFRYDGRSRLAEKKLPGKGWEYMVYDKQDRLVMTQDANLGANQQWLFTKYDQFSRIAYTGIFTGSQIYGGAGRSYEQGEVEKVINNTERKSSSGFTAPGLIVYYDNDAAKNYPNTITKLLSVNYYDTYPNDQPSVSTLGFTQPFISDNAQQNNISTKGLPTASYLNNIEMNSWTKALTYYDDKGRPFATYSKNYLGGVTKTESVLDFTGTPQSTLTRHTRKSTDIEVKIAERFKYDYQNRLKEHYHQIDSKPEVLLTNNTYDELGRLVNKQVGNNLQDISYAYNIRGWMTGINNTSSLGSDLFAYKINYNTLNIPNTKPYLADQSLEVKKRYNGNISQIDWISVNPDLSVDPLKSYGYSYDKLNRLNAGFYYSFNSGQYSFTGENNELPRYDVNGNITSLKRFSYYLGTASSLIDDLSYTYTNTGNRVTSIADDSQDSNGYEGGGRTIGYDSNGNMTNMLDKGINKISYNNLNLPNEMDIGSGKRKASISNTYRADGTKLKKIYTSMGLSGNSTWVTKVATTHYIDGFQYLDVPSTLIPKEGIEDDNDLDLAMEREAFQREEAVDLVGPPGGSTLENAILQFVPTAEGYYSFTENRYIYQYKDHLGNARVSFARNNTTGAIEVTDKNNYYPFGMNHLDINSGAFFGQSSYKNYKYNGKELQETGMYDYGARMYMPDIGRWGMQDDHQELYNSYSPYHYVANNPVILTDPDGRDWYYTNDGQYLYDKRLNKDNASQFFKDNKIEAAYAFESNTMGDFHYGANGTIYDDSKAGSGTAYEDGTMHDIKEVIITKSATLGKIGKSLGVAFNMYSGFEEMKGGIALLFVPEPTTLTKIAGGYLAADGAVRFTSGPVQFYGIWKNNKQLENVPSNLLGVVGNGIDNLNSAEPGYVTGGKGQLVGEMMGDIGLAHRGLYKAVMSPQGVSKMKDYLRLGKIANGVISPAKTGYMKGQKIKENEK